MTVARVGFSPLLSFFPKNRCSWDGFPLGSPYLTYRCFTMSPGNPFIFGSKVKGQGHMSQNRCWCGSLYSCECWLLVVRDCNWHCATHTVGVGKLHFTKQYWHAMCTVYRLGGSNQSNSHGGKQC